MSDNGKVLIENKSDSDKMFNLEDVRDDDGVPCRR